MRDGPASGNYTTVLKIQAALEKAGIEFTDGDGGGIGDWGLCRRLTSWGAAWIGRLLLPQVYARVSDPLSGCYLVRREAIQEVELKPLGYKSLMEILVRGKVVGIHECGYKMRKRIRGQSKVHALHPVQYIRHVFRLRVVTDVDANFDRQHAGNVAAKRLERALHRFCVRRFLRGILDFPDDDVLDHGQRLA